MSDDSDIRKKLEEVSRELKAVVNGIKITLICLLIVASIANIWMSFSIHYFMDAFREMLEGEPLPPLTLLVIAGRPIWMLTSVVLPVVGIALLAFSRRHDRTILVTTVFLVIISVQFTVIRISLFLPLEEIVRKLGS